MNTFFDIIAFLIIATFVLAITIGLGYLVYNNWYITKCILIIIVPLALILWAQDRLMGDYIA